jgi:hypothetical protein
MTATILPPAETTFLDSNGKPLAGGQVFSYVPNTTTPKNTYQDAAQTILNTNPIILDAAGRAIIWGSGTYRQVVYDQFGNLIWDQITEDPNAGLTGNLTDDIFVAGTDFTPGVTTSLTLTSAPDTIANTWIYFDGVYQDDTQVTINGLTLTFGSPIPVGVGKVTVKIGTTIAMGTPGSGTVTDDSVAVNAGIKSSKLSYLQGGAGSISRTVQSKFQDIISVKDFGAKGDGTTDDTNAVQSAFGYISSVGGTLWFPAGNYLITGSGVTLDLSAIIDNQNIHVQICGSGSGATQIFYNGSGTALTIKGGAPSSLNTYFKMEDLRLLGVSTMNNSVGIQLLLCSGVIMRNVVSRVFGTGMNATDVLQSAFYDCAFSANGGGVNMNYGSFSPPNAILFSNCEIVSNTNFGALFGNPSTVTFIGGAVQGNGLTGTATDRYGIAVITNNGGALNGALAASFFGVYFENNAFRADIWFQCGNNSDGPTALTCVGCTFNRISNVPNQFVNYNVLVDINPPHPCKLTLVGNGFNGFSPYIPSSTTPYVFINDPGNSPIDFVDYGNLYVANMEKPPYFGPAKTDVMTISSAAVFDGTVGSPTAGFAYNVASITKTGTGAYTIAFQKAGPKSSYPVDVNINGIGYATVNTTLANGVSIMTFNASGVATDFSYISVKVFGNGDIA